MSEITSFLASLGYAAKDVKSWTEAIKSVEKLVVRVGEALAAAGAALSGLVAKTSTELDTLNFTAQRAGTSVGNLRALSYAFAQTGASGDAAGAAIEAFAARMRTNPATERLVNLLGVATRRNGALRDYTDVMLDIADRLNDEPSYVVAAYKAGQFGLTDAQFNQFRMQGRQIRALRDERLEMEKGAGVDGSRAGASSTALMQAHRETMMKLGIMLDAVVVGISPSLVPLIGGLNQWILDNRDVIVQVVDRLINAAVALVDWLHRVVAALAPVAEGFLAFISAATGTNGFVVAVEALSAAWLASIVLRMLGAGGKVRFGVAALAAAFVTGKYIAPEAFGLGDSGGSADTDRPAEPKGFWGRLVGGAKRALGISSDDAAGPKGKGQVFDRGGGDPGTQESATHSTTYSPRAGGDRMEGGYAASRPGPDGQAVVRTLEDYRLGRSDYVTRAASPEFYGRKYTAPEVTYSVDGKTYTLKNVPFYNHDTGGAFRGVPEYRGDIPVGRDLSPRDTNQGLPGLKLKPGWAPKQDPMKGATTAPWGNPNDTMTVPPLTTSMGDDDFSVTTTRRTKITVKGDTDPHRTAADVTSAQRRVNMDLVTSTNKAFA